MFESTSPEERLFGLQPREAHTVHFIGVCGTGMGALARLLKTRGYAVTGSDESVYPPMSDFLKEWGIPVREGFKAAHLDPKPDLVIVGNVVGRHHEEAQALLSGKIPYLSFPEAVRIFFLHEKKTIAVCGTHGKTTTTGLTAWILNSAKRDPGFFVGGIVKGLNISSHFGEGDHFVIEGDEYDTAFFDSRPKFAHYEPDITIVNGIEYDHADLYPDVESIKKAFSLLLEARKEGGWIIFHGDDPNCREIFGGEKRVETFGLGESNAWRAEEITPGPEGTCYQVVHQGTVLTDISLSLWGKYNVLNSLAAFAATRRIGIPPEEIALGLKTFPGMKRRLEIFYDREGVVMMDDFAHHPTAVRGTITAVREHDPNARILAVYEPRSNTSRSDIFQKEYERAFDGADEVVLYQPIQKNTRLLKERAFLDMDLLSRKVNEQTPCLAVSEREALFDAVVKKIKAGASGKKTRVLIMSNGKFEGIYQELPKRMERLK